jgi:hypothetical protein
MAHGLDRAFVHRQQLDLRAGLLELVSRLLELALLDAIRCKKCNAFPFQVLGHICLRSC